MPAASAIEKNHSGTIAGKLNGLMMPTTPSGWRERVDVDAGRDVLGVGALGEVPEAARELDDLHAAGDLAERVGEHLAVLGGEDLGELLLAGVQQLAEVRTAPSGAWRSRRRATAPTPRCAEATAASTSAVEASRTSLWTVPSAGL